MLGARLPFFADGCPGEIYNQSLDSWIKDENKYIIHIGKGYKKGHQELTCIVQGRIKAWLVRCTNPPASSLMS